MRSSKEASKPMLKFQSCIARLLKTTQARWNSQEYPSCTPEVSTPTPLIITSMNMWVRASSVYSPLLHLTSWQTCIPSRKSRTYFWNTERSYWVSKICVSLSVLFSTLSTVLSSFAFHRIRECDNTRNRTVLCHSKYCHTPLFSGNWMTKNSR